MKLANNKVTIDEVTGNITTAGNVISNGNTITKDPTGFTAPESVIVTYDPTAKTITLTGTVVAYWQGSLVAALVSGWVSDAHPGTVANYYLYYNGTSFIWSTDAWTLDMLQIAFVSKSGYALRECHGLMPYSVHSELHNTISCWKTTGTGLISNLTLNSATAANRRPYISATTLNDEDLQTFNPQLITNTYNLRTLSSTDTVNFSLDQAEIVPLNSNRPYFNEFTGGTWQQTLMTDRYYQAVFIIAVPVSADVTSQKYRYQFIQGQTQSASLTQIQSLTKNDVNLGASPTLLPESVFIGKIIIQYINSNWVITQYDIINFGLNLKQYTYIPYLVNTLYIGTQGSFSKLTDAIAWLTVAGNMTANTVLYFDGTGDTITNTITINLPYKLTLFQESSGTGIVSAATGLTNKPMFDIKSEFYCYGMTFDATTLASYGTQSTENCFNVTAGIYFDLQNCVVNGFYKQINFTGAGSSNFIFNSVFNNAVNSSICINTTGTSVSDIETNTFYNCAISLHLLQSSSGEFDFINSIINNIGSQTGILYVPSTGTDNYVIVNSSSITANKWNNTGTFISGFDFSLQTGRDANIYSQNNIGYENKNPHAKINVLNNAATTTITAVNTFYKANLNNTVSIVFNTASTGGTFTITMDGQITGNIAWDANSATMATNIKTAMDALSNVTAVTVTSVVAHTEFSILYTTVNEGWQRHTANISNLTSVTSYYFKANCYTCKFKLESNRATYLPLNSRDCEFWINANLICSNANRNTDIAVAAFTSAGVLKGYFGQMTCVVTGTSAATPTPISTNVYIPDINQGDYFEIHLSKSTNAGETLTLQDVNWLLESK